MCTKNVSNIASIHGIRHQYLQQTLVKRALLLKLNCQPPTSKKNLEGETPHKTYLENTELCKSLIHISSYSIEQLPFLERVHCRTLLQPVLHISRPFQRQPERLRAYRKIIAKR